jgi:hypothetical protein
MGKKVDKKSGTKDESSKNPKEDNKEINVVKNDTTISEVSIENVPDEDPNKKIEIKNKQNRQIVIAIILMVAIIVIILAVPYARDNLFNNFKYKNMEFSKSMVGKIPFYNTQLPLYSQKVFAATGTGLAVEEINQNRIRNGSYILTLRQDPRDLEDIEVDLDINNITFVKQNTMYVTYNASDPKCEHNVISAADLARFLINFGGFDVKGAVMNKDYASANKIPYVTCENYPENTVIMVVASNQTRISKVKERCYKLEYSNCEMLDVSNKFILSIAEGYINSNEGIK